MSDLLNEPRAPAFKFNPARNTHFLPCTLNPCVYKGFNFACRAFCSRYSMTLARQPACKTSLELGVHIYPYIYIYIYIYIGVCMHACMDGRTDGRTDGRREGGMDGWMDLWIYGSMDL